MGKDTTGLLAFEIRDWLNNAQRKPRINSSTRPQTSSLKSIFVAKALPTFAPLYNKDSCNI